jgi:hypothetical protein
MRSEFNNKNNFKIKSNAMQIEMRINFLGKNKFECKAKHTSQELLGIVVHVFRRHSFQKLHVFVSVKASHVLDSGFGWSLDINKRENIKEIRRAYVNIELLIETIVHQQIVSHSYSVRFLKRQNEK